MIAVGLHRADWPWGMVEYADRDDRRMFCVDAHRDAKRFVVNAEDLTVAFLELEAQCRAAFAFSPPSMSAPSPDLPSPVHMSDYVPESLTEVIIAHGARSMPLDAELREIAGLILQDSDGREISDAAIRAYMEEGTSLVRRVLEQQT